jgi:hypothetical protein
MDYFLVVPINWIIGTKFERLRPGKQPVFEHLHELSGGCGLKFRYTHLNSHVKKNQMTILL